MTLPSSTSSKINDGVVLIQFDDILEGGPTARHRKKLTASIADGSVASAKSCVTKEKRMGPSSLE
eukprot:10270710-Karenia_brevis.AAC.1